MRASFSVGYDGVLADLRRILDCSRKVASVYTGGPAGRIGGGRPQHAKTLAGLAPQIEFAHRRGVSFEIAMNAPCGIPDRTDRVWWRRTRDYVRELAALGVDAVIVSHPFLMDLVKTHTRMRVVASTICEVMNARSARWYERLGADVLIPSMNVNKDLAALRAMRRALKTTRLRIMVNEHCLGDCPWRRFHHAHYAHSDSELDYHANCKRAYLKEPWLLLTNSAVRPEDLGRYEGIADEFKIVGRLTPISDLLLRVKAYSEGRFRGNYVRLLDSKLAAELSIPNQVLDGLAGPVRESRCRALWESAGSRR